MSVSDANFEQLVKTGKTVVLFTLRTSGPAKRMSEYLSKVKGTTYLADAAVCRETCAFYGIKNIPATAIFQEGKLVACSLGQMNEADFLQFCKS